MSGGAGGGQRMKTMDSWIFKVSERQKGSKWFMVSAALSCFLPQLFSLKTGTSKQQVSFFSFFCSPNFRWSEWKTRLCRSWPAPWWQACIFIIIIFIQFQQRIMVHSAKWRRTEQNVKQRPIRFTLYALSGRYRSPRHFNFNVEHLHCVSEFLLWTSEIELT